MMENADPSRGRYSGGVNPDSDPSSLEAQSPIEVQRRFLSKQTHQDLLRTFSPAERLLLYVLTAVMAFSALAIVAQLNAAISVTVPTHGGTFTEGELGPARFINPILTMSQADEDLTELVYSGLMRAMPDGSVVPDLASSYTVSPDGTTYTFTIRPDATFHNGTRVTSADVAFTVAAAQNPNIKSPRRADWEGVDVTTPDAQTVVFKLPHAYAPFIENTTLGIVPKSLWQNVSAEEFPFSPLNTHPIGSGPYKFASVDTDSTGSATRYDLVPFKQYVLGSPYLDHIVFLFFPNSAALMTAFNKGTVDALAGVTPSDLAAMKRTDTQTLSVPLPRVFGVFFNQGRNTSLADASVRAALDQALDKQAIVKNVLGGFGIVLNGPIPPGVLSNTNNPVTTPTLSAGSASSSASTSTPTGPGADAARATLTKGGWTYDAGSNTWSKAAAKKGGSPTPLAFTLATADQPELVATANEVARQWKAIGMQVSVQVYPLAEFNTNVIRPRNYDAILFGEVVGREGDLFAFWHSSQRNDPGLNLSMYANLKTDALLAQARATTDKTVRNSIYQQFASLLMNDKPAVFLYSPEFVYVVPTSVHGIMLGALTEPAERFLNVYDWYIDMAHVWSIFANRTR